MLLYRLLFALNLAFLTFGSSEEMDKPIIIIGSGLAGFSAARKLMENDFNDIIILEAENRIGGRINSVPFSDGIIDLGAQWVHGQKNNLIYEMTSKHFKFGTTPFEELDSTFLLSNGTLPDQRIFRKLQEIGFKIVDRIDDMDDPQGSIGEIFLKEFDRAIKAPKNKLGDVSPEIIKLAKEDMHRNINAYYASQSWFDLSAKKSGEEELAKGNQYNTWKKQGFRTVFDFLSKKLPDPSQHLDIESKVQFNKIVRNIKYDKEDEIVVTCKDGSSFIAKHVIFTPSLGVLKKYHDSLFRPSLPEKKVQAIKSYGFGVVGKVFLEFSEPFWKEGREPFLSYELLWLEDDKKIAKEANREWMLDITAVYAVDQFPNILEFFLGGERINKFESASDEKIVDDCMWALEKFLGKSLPRPIAMQRTKWLTNENFLGAYSYGSMESEKKDVGVKEIASTIKGSDGKPILLFAGEAADDKYPSMAHGAVRSGFRAAREIIDYYE